MRQVSSFKIQKLRFYKNKKLVRLIRCKMPLYMDHIL